MLRLAPVKENRNNCPFLTENHCAIHDAEPLVCALYPLAQRSSVGKYTIFYSPPVGQGGDRSKGRITLPATMCLPGKPLMWVLAQTCMALEDTVEQLETVLSPVLVRRDAG